MDHETKMGILAVLAVCAVIYGLFTLCVALGNATDLANKCSAAHRHWQANPLTLGTSGKCVPVGYN